MTSTLWAAYAVRICIHLQLLVMGPATVCAGAACCCNVTQAAVHLRQLAVAGVILQPDMLLLGARACRCLAALLVSCLWRLLARSIELNDAQYTETYSPWHFTQWLSLWLHALWAFLQGEIRSVNLHAVLLRSDAIDISTHSSVVMHDSHVWIILHDSCGLHVSAAEQALSTEFWACHSDAANCFALRCYTTGLRCAVATRLSCR